MRAVSIMNIVLGAVICLSCLQEAAGKPLIECGIGIGNAFVGTLGVILGLHLWSRADMREAIANRLARSRRRRP